MRIIRSEIKKIFDWKIIVILGVGALILFYMYPEGYLSQYKEQPRTQITEIIKEMRSKYGNTLDKKEQEKVVKELFKEKKREANEYIARDKMAKSLGIKTYDELTSYSLSGNGTERETQLREIHERMIFNENSKELWNMEAIQVLENNLQNRELQDYYKGDKRQKRYEEVALREEQALISEQILMNINGYIDGLSQVVLFITMGLLGSIFIKDRQRKVDYLQFTSKVGRNIKLKKVMAGLISIAVVTFSVLAFSMAIYFMKNGSMEFFNTNINSIFTGEYHFDITYLQYIILKLGVIYILTIAIAAITMWISNVGETYLKTLCLWSVAFIAFKFIITKAILCDMINLYAAKEVKIGLVILVAIGAIISILKIKDKKQDILY